MKKPFIIFSVLLFIYMFVPGPSRISSFIALPDSVKSDLAGDNEPQVPNVAGYFSNNFRDFVVPFYRKNLQDKSFLPFLPLRINYPPEYSFVAIKKHTDTTYLEEIVYPLRNSLYVNGFEPFYKDGTQKYWGAEKFVVGGKLWYTKTTIRFYPSSVFIRFLVFLGIISSILFLYKVGREVLFNK